jgi:hypothetical protein
MKHGDFPSFFVNVYQAGYHKPIVIGVINHEIIPINYSYIYHKTIVFNGVPDSFIHERHWTEAIPRSCDGG